MKTVYLILPGYGNSDGAHWQTFFEKMLPNVVRVHQKSWDKPVCEDWIETINEAVKMYDPTNVVLVSHSLGGIAIAHWAAKCKIKIKGAMLVAPPDLDAPWQDLGLESFAPMPLLTFPFPSVVVASTNDNWMFVDRSVFFAEKWGSKLLFIDNAGHINAASGYGKWQEGLDILKTYF